MTTPDLPQAAIKAAAGPLADATNCQYCKGTTEPCGICTALAIIALTTALPHLGDTTTEWASGSPGLQVASFSETGARRSSYSHQTRLWRRTVITGEWTEAPSE